MQFLFTATIFLAAFLLFLVQPMVGKNVLPIVGGAPAVWNSCMLLFQFLLLAGYAWAHWAVKKLGLGRQAVLQLVLMVAALFFLPDLLAISRNAPEEPAMWLVLQLLKTVGLPFFVLASISPLLQLWFANSGHSSSDNPYFLFAASNMGSFAALLIYPILFEPAFGIVDQSRIWAGGFVMLLVMLFACRQYLKPESLIVVADESVENQITVNKKTRLKWLVAGLLPSALLLTTTQFLTADISPIPLLWVVPLAIYLLSWAMAFSRFNLATARIEALFLVAILVFPVAYFKLASKLWLAIPLHLLILFAVALYCHSFLASSRPPAKGLTGFYVITSMGSVVGSVLVTFAAPLLFSNDAEYPLLIIFAGLLSRHFYSGQQLTQKPEARQESLILTFAMGLYVAALFTALDTINFSRFLQQTLHAMGFDPGSGMLNLATLYLAAQHDTFRALLLISFALLPVFILKKMPQVNLALFSLVSIGLLAISYAGTMPVKLYSSRNFFGIKKVTVSTENNTITLVHGSTMHGLQSLLLDKMLEPLAYFHRNGPCGSIFDLELANTKDFRVAILGLGIGSLLAYAKPEQEFTFYEIDPEVIKIAQNPDYFVYLSSFQDRCRVICGDGRRAIEKSPLQYFDLIFMDAFSSDSIPVHLLTREAIKMYFERLKPHGAIVVNISNRYVRLKLMLGAIARHDNLLALYTRDNIFDSKDPENFGRNVSDYVILSKSQDFVTELKKSKKVNWQDLISDQNMTVQSLQNVTFWTDAKSSLFPLLRLFN